LRKSIEKTSILLEKALAR